MHTPEKHDGPIAFDAVTSTFTSTPLPSEANSMHCTGGIEGDVSDDEDTPFHEGDNGGETGYEAGGGTDGVLRL